MMHEYVMTLHYLVMWHCTVWSCDTADCCSTDGASDGEEATSWLRPAETTHSGQHIHAAGRRRQQRTSTHAHCGRQPLPQV